MDPRWQYLWLMAGCVVITLPLEFIFRARVYRRLRHLVTALIPVVVLFVVWDVIAINFGVWTYNPQYITGLHLGVLPVEELVFFIVIPICGLLTYEAVGNCLRWITAYRARKSVT